MAKSCFLCLIGTECYFVEPRASSGLITNSQMFARNYYLENSSFSFVFDHAKDVFALTNCVLYYDAVMYVARNGELRTAYRVLIGDVNEGTTRKTKG
jgi:hypothetical protein